MNNVIGVALSSIYIAFILFTSKFVQKFGNEASRKYVHIALCNIWFFYLKFIDNIYVACILPALFVIINSLSYKFNIIKSMEREDKDSLGTVYYAISILLISIFAYYFNKPEVGLLGLLIMGYADGFAAVVGQNVKSKEIKIGKSTTKSVAGSITMFLISLVLALSIFYFSGASFFMLKALGIAVLATALEIVSIKGTDNLTVPIVVTILTFFAM